MTIPREILELVEQLINELDCIEQQANEGLAIARKLLQSFPNNARLMGLFANLGNVLFFVDSFRRRIESIVRELSETNVSIEAVQEAGEELSEVWGRILECKISVNRSVGILEDLQ